MQKTLATQILPRTIVNPTGGYSVTFLVSASETNNKFTYVEAVLPPGKGTPLHYHLDFTETFEAVEGTLGIELDNQIMHLRPSHRPAFVPRKSVHRFFNPGNTPIVFRATVKPARRFEQMLRVNYGLAADGKCNEKGLPKNLLTLALVYEIGESYLPGMPLFLQRSIFGVLARIAKWRGKDKELEKYYVGRIEPRKAAGPAKEERSSFLLTAG